MFHRSLRQRRIAVGHAGHEIGGLLVSLLLVTLPVPSHLSSYPCVTA